MEAAALICRLPSGADDLPDRSPWLKLSLTVMPAAFLMHMDKQVMVVLAPLVEKEFSLDLVSITRILAATTLFYGLFQIPGAWLAVRLGPLLTLGLCVVGWSFIVFLTPFAIGPMSLLLFRGAMGVLQAPDWLSSVMILEREVSVRLRSRGSSALLGAAYMGAFTSGPMMAVIATRFGWRACFLIVGTIGLIFGAGLLVYVVRFVPKSLTKRTKRPPTDLRWTETIRHPRIHALATTYLLFSGVQSFVYILLPTYLAHDRRTALIEIGGLSSAPFIALYFAVLGGGILSDAIFKWTHSLFLARVPTGGGAMISSGVCFAIGMSLHGITPFVLFTCAGMAFVGLGQVILWSAVQDAASGVGPFATAWVQILGAIGFGLAPLLAAWMVSVSGNWDGVRFLLLAMGVGAAACLWIAQPQRPIARLAGAATER